MSARKSIVTQKAEIARRRKHPDANKAMLEVVTSNHRPPPQEVLDAIADKAFLGDYRVTYDDNEDGTRTISASDKCSCGMLLTRLGQCPLC